MNTVQDHLYSLLRQGHSVTFASVDPLNPGIGIRCMLEGAYGRVSGDSIDSIPLALHRAVVEYSGHSLGHHSNRQPILSLADTIRASTDSTLVQLLEIIRDEREARWAATILAG
jgi:hypothetical protein